MKKIKSKSEFFPFFFRINRHILKMAHCSYKNKHHIQKEHGPKSRGMGFPGDSSISKFHFGTKRVK